MSEKRRKRREGREREPRPWPVRKIVIATVILAAVAAAALFGKHKKDHHYDAFAKCLKERNVVMYGAYWCPHCADEKEKFGASFKYVPYVECGIPGNRRGQLQVCKDAGIQRFPTWQFPPTGERVEGEVSFEDLSARTGCSLP